MKQYQQLSCREAGQFDYKQRQAGKFLQTGWGKVCSARCKAGTSRRLRIKTKKEAQ